MAYTNNNGQARVGVRIVPLSVVIPTISTLLDSYSGASAAYSLRKLKSSYTGSAIRVRRSSDNTEQNIGFDSNGNLDTYALSSFVGSGSGYVTTWYDQSGNGNNATKTIASSQPRIVNAGIIETVGGKPAIRWLVIGGAENLLSMNTSLSNVRSVFLNITYLSGIARVPLLGHTTAYDYHSDADVHLSSQYAADYVKNGNNYINGVSKTLATFAKSTSNSLITMIHTSASGNVNQISSDRNIGRWDWSFFTGYFSEIILYSSDQTTNRTQIESNINSYYSIYPNPTSVWNLLTAVYNADTKSLPSLKTSLVAAYNGESNANDSFGTNNGTAVGGLTYTTGKIGNAFNFNGTTSYINIPNVSDQFNFSNDFSISLWFNPLNTTSQYQVLFTNKSSTATNGGYVLYYERGSINKLRFEIQNGSNYSTYESSFLPSANTWYHLTITRKKSTSTKMYINGSIVGGSYNYLGGASNIDPLYQTGQIYSIGSYGTTALSAFAEDAINVWSKELTQSEITELYNSGNGAQYIGDNFYKPTTNDALNTYNGTAQGGLTYGLGKVGTAFQFNGTNAYVQLPNNSFNFTGDFSASLWVNFPSMSWQNGQLIDNTCWDSSGSGTSGWRLYYLYGSLGFYIYRENGLVQLETYSLNQANVWYHIVITTSSSGMKIYLNGALSVSNTSTTRPNYPNVVSTRLGASRFNTQFTTCKMDGLSVWQKTLTQAEVTELYNSGNGKQYPN